MASAADGSRKLEVTRRSLLIGAGGAAVSPAVGRTYKRRMKDHVAVIGAGVFGAWTAHHLQQSGHKVTLIDAWGPAHVRASSGGESRLTRAAYGKDAIYTRMARDSLALWNSGAYGGHPNPARGQCVWGDGTIYTPDLQPLAAYVAPITKYVNGGSSDGIAEYRSDAFGGALRGNLISATYAGDQTLRRVVLSPDGSSVQQVQSLGTFVQPLDVWVDVNGNVFVAEYGANRVTVLVPTVLPSCPVPNSDPKVTDSDGDGYTDYDETSNGTDPCSAASKPAAGIVMIHAHTMFPATPHRTALIRFKEPTPMIAPVIVCVVLTGIPARAVPNRVKAPALSAQNPPRGLSLVIFEPIVWTTRQPPKYVPRAMAVWAERIMNHLKRPHSWVISSGIE